MKLSFFGGAREVTGACYLLETKDANILVDCGIFQGSREYADRNYDKCPFDPAKIDFLVVSHAHIDHVGRIPKLVKGGFKGTIFSTAPTKDLAELMIKDALHLAERTDDALYNEADIEKMMSLWRTISYRKTEEHKGVRFELREAGHILGSATITFWAEGKKILFTGDLGNVPSALLYPPERFHDIEYLVIESTYGNRTHEPAGERVLSLERAVEDVAARGGTLMIPCFATERTQDILFYLNEMLHMRRIPEMPAFVDSPLAIRVTEVFERYPLFYNDEIKKLYRDHPNLFKSKKLQFTESVEESKHINDVHQPKVVIAGSGMLTGGRILHHARRYLPDPKSILLIAGYQAAGSLGRRLMDGEKVVKILGEEVAVEAEIRKITGFSAHADNPQLFSFVETNRDTLKRVFVVQGEEASAMHFAQEVKDRLGVQADAPNMDDTVEI